MDVEIHPVFVKESQPHDAVMGAGWVSRTWEKEMIAQGKAEISELITPEQDFCPVLTEPRVTYGDRDFELLKIAQAEAFDLFVEGVHFPWTTADLHRMIHRKLYQKIPSPVILLRTLRKINQVQLLCLDITGTQTLAKVFQKIWKNCSAPLVLNCPAAESAKGGGNGLREAVDQAKSLLEGSGCTVGVQETLSFTPGNEAADTLTDSSLVAIAMDRDLKRDSSQLQWLHEVKTASLLAFH